MFTEQGKAWQAEHMAMIDDRIRVRLRELTAHLGGDDWLDGGFSAADIMMVHVIQRLKGAGLLEEFPTLVAYIARAEARPAFQRSFAAQLAVFQRANDRA